MRVLIVLTLAALAFALPAPPSQSTVTNLVANAGFETPDVAAGFAGFDPGSADLTGWQVGGSGVDVLSPDWRAAEGDQSLDLSASAPGQVSQDLATTAGAAYRISWSNSMNPECGDASLDANVRWNGAVVEAISLTAPVVPWTAATVDWSPASVVVNAIGPTSTLTFEGVTSTACGIMIDAVRVAPVDASGSNAAPTLAGPFGLDAGSGSGSVNVLAGANDPDGDEALLQVVAWEQTPYGSISCTTAGLCTYTLIAQEAPASDSFDVVVEDAGGAQSIGVVNVSFGCAPPSYTISNGDPASDEGAVSVTVDGLGSVAGATFNPTGPEAARLAVIGSKVYASIIDAFLSTGGCALSASASHTSDDSVVTTANVGGLELNLEQLVNPVADGGTTLSQRYTFSNTGNTAVPLTLVRTANGLPRGPEQWLDGSASKEGGRRLLTFDTAETPNALGTAVGIGGSLNYESRPDAWSIQPEYAGNLPHSGSSYSTQIREANGIPETDKGLVWQDANTDGIADSPGYDARLSQQWDHVIDPGETIDFITTTSFGQARPNDPPIAQDHQLTTSGGTGQIDVMDGVSGPEEHTVSFVETTNGTAGTVSCTTTGLCTYSVTDPAASADSFDYTIEDALGARSTGLVTITIPGDLPSEQPSPTPTESPTPTPVVCPDLRNAVSGQAGLVGGHEWIECSAENANGTSTKVTPMMPSPDGAFGLMTTGDRGLIDQTNTTGSAGVQHFTTLRGAHDVSIVRLDLTVPPGANCLTFDAVFASEEYPEWIGKSFNDGFIAELDSSTWSVSGSTITAPNNFALDAQGKILSVDSAIFDGATSTTGTQYDGATGLLRVQTPVTPGEHPLFLSIFDGGDNRLDSAAFVDRLTTGTVEGGCAAGVAPIVESAPASETTPEDTPVDVQVVADSLEPGVVEVVVSDADQPEHGTATVQSVADGFAFIDYKSDDNWHGTDTFEYTATLDGAASTSTVTVTVAPVDDVPTADDVEITDGRTAAPFTINIGGTDVDDTDLEFEVISPPGMGTVGPLTVVSCEETPVAGYDTGSVCTVVADYDYDETLGTPEGPDTFQYIAVDPDVDPAEEGVTRLESAPATVTVGFGTEPGAPTNVSGTGTDGAAEITWDPPEEDGGSPVTAYKVTCAPGGTFEVAGTVLSKTITGLTNNVDHVCSVVAHNDFGDGPASATVTVKPLDTTPPPALQQLALKPELRKGTLSWIAPISSDYYGLKILMKGGTTPSASPTDGVEIFNKTHGQTGFAGPFVKTLPTPGKTFSFTAFTYDNAVQGANHSTPVSLYAFGTSITMTRTPATVVGAGTATMTATLKYKNAAGTFVPLVAKNVMLMMRKKTETSETAWAPWSNRQTNASGVATFTHNPRQHYEYKAVFAGSAQEFGSESARQIVLYKPKLTGDLVKTSMPKGTSTQLKGAISPQYAGKKIFLEEKIDGSWTPAANKVLGSPSGTPSMIQYVFTIAGGTKGTHTYRVLFKEVQNVNLSATTSDRVLKVL